MADDALMIGVSGMRGTVGGVGGTLTPRVVSRMAGAYATYLWSRHDRSNDKPPHVVIGRDSRPSGQWARDAAVASLVAAGCEVTDLGIVTTPGVAMRVEQLEADAGMVVTASHNPIQWNGLKLLDGRGVAPPPAEVAQVIEFYEKDEATYVTVDRLVKPRADDETHSYHVQRVLDRVDVLGVSTKAFKVVVDSVNGAGCVTSATLLEQARLPAGPSQRPAERPVPARAGADGGEPARGSATPFASRRRRSGSPRTRTPTGWRSSTRTGGTSARSTRWRCARGTSSARSPAASWSRILSTSRMVDDVAAKYGGRVVRTPVGEANVIDAMLREGATIGGEGNGGVIDPRIVKGRDSLVGMAYVLQLMADTGKTIGELVAEMPSYAIVKDKLPLARKEDAADGDRQNLCEVRQRKSGRQRRPAGRLARRLAERPGQQHRADPAVDLRGARRGGGAGAAGRGPLRPM